MTMTKFPSVESLLPHSHPMILVDELTAADKDHVEARLRIRENSPLVTNGTTPALTAIEYMAQSIGLLTGYESFSRREPVQVGYLLGTRDLKLSVSHFSVGDELTILVNRLFGEDELGAFKCQVIREGKTAAEAVLNVYRNKDHVLPGRQKPV